MIGSLVWAALPNRAADEFAGSASHQLLAETRIEGLPAAPDGELGGIEDWVTALAEQAANQLLSGGAGDCHVRF